MKYAITVRGCDDETVAHVELTTDQLDGVLKVANRINAVRYVGCQPAMNVSSGPKLPAETSEDR